MFQLGTAIALAIMAAAQAPAAQTSRLGVRERPQVPGESPQRRIPCRAISSPGEWSLEGTLITPDEVIHQGVITIAGKKIAAVKAIGPGPSCATKIDGIILPGLIDLHNHLTWNVHPRWQPPKHYANRAEWRLSVENKETLVQPQDRLVWTPPGLGCEANLYGEVKALVGGATSAVGGLDHHAYGHDGRCITGLIRNLDYGSQFSDMSTKGGLFDALHAGQDRRTLIDPCAGQTPDGDPIADVAVNVIFPLGAENAPPAADIPGLSQARADYLLCNLNSGRLRSLLVHLAEGNPADLPSRQEFAELQALGLVQEGLIIVHGTALQPQDFVALQSSGVGLVWSPRSNIELYGATLDIPAARNAGVTIAIAPDWSPTGSDGMLQELNYARANFTDFDAEQLTSMATSIPARLARVDDRIGQLKAGLYADLLVIRRKEGSAYDSVVTASPADVQLVVIGGRPVYGDSALMQQLAPGKDLVPMTICGVSKAVDLSETIATQSSWNAVKDLLQQRLSQGMHPTSLAPVGCPRVLPSKPMPGPLATPDIIQAPSPGPVEN